MICFPNAKINLGLRVTSKREDGFHDLDTVFFPVPLHDVLEVITPSTGSADAVTFTHSGIPIPGDVSANLCIKAYYLLKKDYPDLPSILLHLHKHIPMGAGLGGGSSDGAFMLKLLNDKYRLGIGAEQLQKYALALGSDCPFFIINEPVQATGRGEIMQSISCTLSSKTMVLVCPGIHVSTADAFRKIKLSPTAPSCASVIERPIQAWKDNLTNDFEEPVFSAFPEIGNIKEKLYDAGALYASMTGTGSTVYGIFETSPSIKDLFPSHYQLESILL
jgi:4-diphosphocytidyl-2-C-methyl-D-erythritol kinase